MDSWQIFGRVDRPQGAEPTCTTKRFFHDSRELRGNAGRLSSISLRRKEKLYGIYFFQLNKASKGVCIEFQL